MKYTVGDLIYSKGAGLGYIIKITEDKQFNGFILAIEWFINGKAHHYGSIDLDRYISRREAIHYPVGNQ